MDALKTWTPWKHGRPAAGKERKNPKTSRTQSPESRTQTDRQTLCWVSLQILNAGKSFINLAEINSEDVIFSGLERSRLCWNVLTAAVGRTWPLTSRSTQRNESEKFDHIGMRVRNEMNWRWQEPEIENLYINNLLNMLVRLIKLWIS